MTCTQGSQLRYLRQQQGLSLEEVAVATGISSERLEWLESDRLAEFGSLTYAQAFARLYDSYLGAALPEANAHERPKNDRLRLLPRIVAGSILLLAGWMAVASMG